MKEKKRLFKTIDDYISQFPKEKQVVLETLRKVIKETAPNAEEKISYQIPTFYLNGNLVQFAAFDNHIGFYPDPSAMEKFKDDLSQYKVSKGSVQFPLMEELPYDLIREIIIFRVDENKNL